MNYLPKIFFFQLLSILNLCAYAQKDSIPKWGAWSVWGDLGNGFYANPILPADYSDIDCIRVGNDYYAISSTLQYSPGMIILHSKDLVNWEITGHAVDDITQISPEMNYDRMNRYGKGIWAGAIRYHNKKFWIFFGTPDEGYFMTTAQKPEGPWEPLHQIFNEKGWDDCCPFWDDDGQAYFIGTNFSDGYKIHLFNMSTDGKTILKETDKVIYQSKGSEANKLYKINGIYYHFFSEVKTDGRAIMMERAKNIWGPYSKPKQLSATQKKFNEPNQGGFVQTPNGNWYFLTHHGTGDWSGRIMSLLPVNWVDGWPIVGDVGKDTIGQMVWRSSIPVRKQKKIFPQTSDEFTEKKLGQQWEWNYQPKKENWSLLEREGWIRLYASKPIEAGNLLKAANILTQRSFRTSYNEAIVKIDISHMTNGQHAGLSHFGSPNYSAVGITCTDSGKILEFNVKGKLTDGPTINGKDLWLRSTWGLDGKSEYAYSTDGKNYKTIGNTYQLMWGSYRGDRLAIYSYNDNKEEGFVDVDFFHYNFTPPVFKQDNSIIK